MNKIVLKAIQNGAIILICNSSSNKSGIVIKSLNNGIAETKSVTFTQKQEMFAVLIRKIKNK